MTPLDTNPRYHALDSLRASMMLLGIYLHVAVGYARVGNWPYKDANPTDIFNLTLGFIHMFRMPLFYIMAGFFAALLYNRRSPMGFIRNRAQRVLLVFAAGWAILFPVTAALWIYGKNWRDPRVLRIAWDFMASGQFWRHAHPLHLWFLEYLVLLYLLFLVVAALARRIPRRYRQALNTWFRAGLGSAWRPAIFAVPYFLALTLTHTGHLEDPPSFMPVARILTPYIVVFGFGWLLFENVDLLSTFRRFAWTQVAASIATGLASLFFFDRQMAARPARDLLAFYACAALASLTLWLLAFGLTGMFLRYLDRRIPRMRYLSDSSYWLYLLHGPVVIVLQLLMAPLAWPTLVKAAVVLPAAVGVLLVSYHFCVRPTLIGQILNGRRYPLVSVRMGGGLAAQPSPEGEVLSAAGGHCRPCVESQ